MSERERLRAENAELRRRLELVDAELLALRDEAQARRAKVRQLAESLPTAVSRRALVAQMTKDAIGHPDKTGIATRALRKIARTPRRLVHILGFGPKALPPGDPVATTTATTAPTATTVRASGATASSPATRSTRTSGSTSATTTGATTNGRPTS